MHANVIEPPILIRMMENILTVMTINEDYLTRLDSEIGDADHGINMVRGFQLVHQRLVGLDDPDVEAVLSTVGMSLMEGAGGSSGALYGMFFSQGAQQLHGKREIDRRDLALFFSTGYAAMVEISGGTKPGEKTMIDALDPAVKSLNESAGDDGLSMTIALQRAVEAAKTGLESTIGLVATKGRAAYLGKMSRGHQDIGATTMYLIIRTMLDTLEGKVGVKVTRHDSSGAILEETYI
ncbi:MAG: dihydroxyacetone kinase subunit DhaL [Candidatus Bathyarchaeota archaeon]|nr:dihydroxyacetone kinase subunit DhaL [Candidatus Bathyarchaeota archaeon]